MRGDDAAPVDPTVERAMETVSGTVERFLSTASAQHAFGAPVVRGETTILPAAETLTVFGFGVGSGSGGESDERGGGGGGGGGGRTLSRAVAVVVAGPSGVEVKPVVDSTKIALAAVTAVGFVFAAYLRLKKALAEVERGA